MPTSPPFCQTCGNIAFTLGTRGHWQCAYCEPISGAATQAAAAFFSAGQTSAAWPDGWTPPKPCGPAQRAINSHY